MISLLTKWFSTVTNPDLTIQEIVSSYFSGVNLSEDMLIMAFCACSATG